MNNDWLARLHFPEGVIEFRVSTRNWVAVGDAPAQLAADANRYSVPPFYSYSPADGYPGHRLAFELAAKLKADRVEYCVVPPSPPGVVH